MNELNFGGDEKFLIAIKAVDGKLEKLLDEIVTGVDAGEQTLIELINSVFDEVTQIENLASEVENESENAGKNEKSIEAKLENFQESIREVQTELDRLRNMTTYDGPEALQNAFDRSEKFDAAYSELKDILGQVKAILGDYEENLANAKNFTSIVMEIYGRASKDAGKAVETQEFVVGGLKETGNFNEMEEEFENIRKVVGKAFAEANIVYNDAFELLNEVTVLEIDDKLSDMNKRIEKLNIHSYDSQANLEEFSQESLKTLNDFETTIDAAQILEAKAFELQDKILAGLEVIKTVHADALKAIAEKDAIVKIARDIYNSLDDFTLKVEKSRESARMAMEKIPEILKKIQDSVKIVEKLEDRLDNQTKSAEGAKEKCSIAKTQMDEILFESDEIKAKIKQLEAAFEGLPDEARSSAMESMRMSDTIETLERNEAEDDKLIEATQIKIGNMNSKSHETDEKVDETLEKLQALMDEVAKLKNIDEGSLNKFGTEIAIVTQENFL